MSHISSIVRKACLLFASAAAVFLFVLVMPARAEGYTGYWSDAGSCCKRCLTNGGTSADISFTLDGQTDSISCLKAMMIAGQGLPITAACGIC